LSSPGFSCFSCDHEQPLKNDALKSKSRRLKIPLNGFPTFGDSKWVISPLVSYHSFPGFYLTTHPLYPPPLIREGEDIKKEGASPLLNTPVFLPRSGFGGRGY